MCNFCERSQALWKAVGLIALAVLLLAGGAGAATRSCGSSRGLLQWKYFNSYAVAAVVAYFSR